MATTQKPDILSPEYWRRCMGRDLPRAAHEPLQPVFFRGRAVKVGREHVRYRFEESSRPAVRVVDGCFLIVDSDDGGAAPLGKGWGGTVTFELPDNARALLPEGDAVPGMLVNRDGVMELRPIRIVEHAPDILRPRLFDELVPASGGQAASLTRHVITGYGYDEWTADKLDDYREQLCRPCLRCDPVAPLAEGDDWVGWRTRREITGAMLPGDQDLRGRLEEDAFDGQGTDGSWQGALVPTCYGILRARSVDVPFDDPRLRRAAEWLLSRPEPQGRPGMWMLTDAAREEWDAFKAGKLSFEGRRRGHHIGIGEGNDDETACVRDDRQQQTWPTCARHFGGLCDNMLHPSAMAVVALCECGHATHPRVRAYANTMLQVAGMYGYFCACWGIDNVERDVEGRPGAKPDFSYSREPLEAAIAAMRYRYARDTKDLCSLALQPNWPDDRRAHLADINGEHPFIWCETGHENWYSLFGSYWQNADCWAKTNRALSRLPGYPASTVAFYSQFQCHLYQTDTGAWDQAFAAGNLRQIAEMSRQAMDLSDNAPEVSLARRMVIGTVPWLREHQGDDGLWDFADLPRMRGGKPYAPPSARTSSYHIVSVLKRFGLLEELRP